MRVALQISTSALGTRCKVDREGEPGKQDGRFRNIILSFEGHDLGGVHIILSPTEANVLVEQVLTALES
ncbi:MAG: hypothetical protein AAB270_06850 [Chloroflexota bacterium]